jgi:hypothetical protein
MAGYFKGGCGAEEGGQYGGSHTVERDVGPSAVLGRRRSTGRGPLVGGTRAGGTRPAPKQERWGTARWGPSIVSGGTATECGPRPQFRGLSFPNRSTSFKFKIQSHSNFD